VGETEKGDKKSSEKIEETKEIERKTSEVDSKHTKKKKVTKNVEDVETPSKKRTFGRVSISGCSTVWNEETLSKWEPVDTQLITHLKTWKKQDLTSWGDTVRSKLIPDLLNNANLLFFDSWSVGGIHFAQDLLRIMNNPMWKPTEGGLVIVGIPGFIEHLNYKGRLPLTLEAFAENTKMFNELDLLDLEHFYPKTYLLPTHEEQFFKYNPQFDHDTIITKVVDPKKPEKIKIYENRTYLDESLDTTYGGEKMLLSTYVRNPLTYLKHKWITRMTLFVTLNPLFAVSLGNMAVFSAEEFNLNDLDNQEVHMLYDIANHHIPKQEEKNLLCYDHILHLADNLDFTDKTFVYGNDLVGWVKLQMEDMYRIVTYVLKAYLKKMTTKNARFLTRPGMTFVQLFGIDVVSDDLGNVWLLEVHRNPSWCKFPHCSVFPGNESLIAESWWEIHQRKSQHLPLNQLHNFGENWRVVIDESASPPYYRHQHRTDIAQEPIIYKKHPQFDDMKNTMDLKFGALTENQQTHDEL